ncbi:hypothetical protein MAR_007157 [Mya arenaria]|uniref:Uncharacterized protein n=1 Tax=Mya arenaria TaxID=6604 RepID=A0ABY7DDK1_MYAAR|nr:hypothetical protein MAR_007157 [Mya arenaria]
MKKFHAVTMAETNGSETEGNDEAQYMETSDMVSVVNADKFSCAVDQFTEQDIEDYGRQQKTGVLLPCPSFVEGKVQYGPRRDATKLLEHQDKTKKATGVLTSRTLVPVAGRYDENYQFTLMVGQFQSMNINTYQDNTTKTKFQCEKIPKQRVHPEAVFKFPFRTHCFLVDRDNEGLLVVKLTDCYNLERNEHGMDSIVKHLLTDSRLKAQYYPPELCRFLRNWEKCGVTAFGDDMTLRQGNTQPLQVGTNYPVKHIANSQSETTGIFARFSHKRSRTNDKVPGLANISGGANDTFAGYAHSNDGANDTFAGYAHSHDGANDTFAGYAHGHDGANDTFAGYAHSHDGGNDKVASLANPEDGTNKTVGGEHLIVTPSGLSDEASLMLDDIMDIISPDLDDEYRMEHIS